LDDKGKNQCPMLVDAGWMEGFNGRNKIAEQKYKNVCSKTYLFLWITLRVIFA